MIIKIDKDKLAVEVPINSFNIGIKLNTLSYDVEGKQTINIYLECDCIMLGDVVKGRYIDSKITKEFVDYLDDKTILSSYGDERYGMYFLSKQGEVVRKLEQYGCLFTGENKYIILKIINIQEFTNSVPLFITDNNDFKYRKCDCGKSGTSVYCINIPDCYYNKITGVYLKTTDAWEEARLYAEAKMNNGNWNRKDEVEIGMFYQFYHEYINDNYTLIKK